MSNPKILLNNGPRKKHFSSLLFPEALNWGWLLYLEIQQKQRVFLSELLTILIFHTEEKTFSKITKSFLPVPDMMISPSVINMELNKPFSIRCNLSINPSLLYDAQDQRDQSSKPTLKWTVSTMLGVDPDDVTRMQTIYEDYSRDPASLPELKIRWVNAITWLNSRHLINVMFTYSLKKYWFFYSRYLFTWIFEKKIDK